MGDLLFYLLKSGCYLIIFYLLFKLLMSGTTFFRFNRVTILAGIIGCMFLPLIEFTTQEETFLTVPLQTIQGIFVEQADGIFWDTMFWVRPQVDETGNMQAINWCPIALGYVYLAGGLFVLCRILLSFYRMFQLIRNGKRRSYGKYKLIVVSEPISSFCWGKYMYNSAEDQVGGGLFSPDTPKEQVKDLLSVMRDAFVEIRADIAQTSGNNSKEYLDKEFPILIGYGDISIKDRKKNPYNNSTTMKITGIHLKLLSAAGKVEKEITNFTLAELERDLKDFCTLQGDKKNEITVSMKVDKECEMGIVTDVKTVLRNNYLLKLNYQ